MDASARDDRLLDLARRLLDGEAIDWAAEGIEESEVREGMKRLQPMLRMADGTETATGKVVVEKVENRFIGDFRLVRKLGEGGMGVVYEAEQQHPKRPVALKVIRGGRHVEDHALRLFQREIQTLARLSHPGIAQLYEAGVTVDGMHFFAMELIRGEPLSEWLRKRADSPVTPAELKLRLGVFRKICDAVAYAHQKGVIHRDLKPGNILIPKAKAGSSTPDAVPEVKILDFGLARMTDTDVQMTTYVTEIGKVQGTLPYMSPEQIRGNPDEIDLRTDVYSLGVLLYEMVTGHLPYDFSKAQLPDAARIICEEAPRSLTTTFRGTRRLDADVATIAGKCLEKETARRYQSAAALGEDVQRYLTDQPILARPPSTAYQFRKLVRRHKGPFAAAAGAFVLLLAFSVAMTVQAARIAKERDRANQERDRANQEAETSRRVSEFLEGLFKVSAPSEARGNAVTAREILDKGAERIERELTDQPEVKARLIGTLANVYGELGIFTRAEAFAQRTLELAEQRFGKESLEAAEALHRLGGVKSAAGQGEDAERLHRRALSIRQKLAPNDPSRLARSLWYVGTSELQMGRGDQARADFERALTLVDGVGLEDDYTQMTRIWLLNDLATVHTQSGEFDRAIDLLGRAQEIRDRIYPTDHPDRMAGYNNIGFALMEAGRFDEARPWIERAAFVAERIYGADGPGADGALHTLAELERRVGNLAESRVLLERCVRIGETSLSHDAPVLAEYLISLARIDQAEGHFADATKRYRHAVAIQEKAWGWEHPAVATTLLELARPLREQGQASEAAALERRAKAIQARGSRTVAAKASANTLMTFPATQGEPEKPTTPPR